ncbi:MAG: hypothetical protein IJR26_00495 [Bacteroidales bacterium]|nr:hypothetical protein [Bacteroidales bacterium]
MTVGGRDSHPDHQAKLEALPPTLAKLGSFASYIGEAGKLRLLHWRSWEALPPTLAKLGSFASYLAKLGSFASYIGEAGKLRLLHWQSSEVRGLN